MNPLMAAVPIDSTIMFLAGLVAALFAFGRIGKKPGLDPTYDARMNRVRRMFRVLGPGLMILALMMFLLPPPPPKAPEWQTVTTSDGECQVSMPGKPMEMDNPSALEGISQPATQQLLLVQENGRVQFYLSSSALEGTYAEMPPEKLLQTISENWFRAANNNGNALRINERDWSDKGWPGRELVIDREDDRLQNRWLVVNKRLYRAYVSTPRDEPHLRDADRFLESFHVRKQADAAKGP